jgi:hypothetical protein
MEYPALLLATEKLQGSLDFRGKLHLRRNMAGFPPLLVFGTEPQLRQIQPSLQKPIANLRSEGCEDS